MPSQRTTLGPGTSRPAARCCRPASAPRPGPRSRSRCLRRGRAPAACCRQAVFSDSQNSPSLVAPSPTETYVTSSAANSVLASGDVRQASVEQAGFGAADGLQALRAGGARLRDDVQARVAPVRGHLAAAAGRVVAARRRRPGTSRAASCRASGTARGRGSTG